MVPLRLRINLYDEVIVIDDVVVIVLIDSIITMEEQN